MDLVNLMLIEGFFSGRANVLLILPGIEGYFGQYAELIFVSYDLSQNVVVSEEEFLSLK